MAQSRNPRLKKAKKKKLITKLKADQKSETWGKNYSV